MIRPVRVVPTTSMPISHGIVFHIHSTYILHRANYTAHLLLPALRHIKYVAVCVCVV